MLDPEGYLHPKDLSPEVLKQLDAVLLLEQEAAILADSKPKTQFPGPGRKITATPEIRPFQAPPPRQSGKNEQRLRAEYTRYSVNYPSVAWEAYKIVAEGKPENFCLFKPNPTLCCVDYGDVENDSLRKKTAMEGYQAALLTEKENSPELNIRIFGSLAQLFIENQSHGSARFFLYKILSINPDNSWAKLKLRGIQRRPDTGY